MRVGDIYPDRYLKSADLSAPVRVKIAEALVTTFRDAKNEELRKVVLSFVGAKKALICNKTQAKATAVAIGSDEIADWPGHEIVLAAGKAPNGAATVLVSPVVAAAADKPALQ